MQSQKMLSTNLFQLRNEKFKDEHESMYLHMKKKHGYYLQGCKHILVAQLVKNPSAMQMTLVSVLGWEDTLEKRMAVNSSNLAWKIPWTEEPGRLHSRGSQRVGHGQATFSFTFKHMLCNIHNHLIPFLMLASNLVSLS